MIHTTRHPYPAALAVTALLALTPSLHAAILAGPLINPANNHAYYLLSQNNWTNSEAEAITLGGHLVSINDAAENAWIASTFSNFNNAPKDLWIGFFDPSSGGSYAWTNGDPTTYTNWRPSEPNFFSVEHAAFLLANPSDNSTWNNYNESFNNAEFPLHGIVELPNAGSPAPEPASLALLLPTTLLLKKRRPSRTKSYS